MRKDLLIAIMWICTTIIIMTGLIIGSEKKQKDEYIKQLEQSLAEQIQEKQVYINILERTSNET